MEGPSSLQGRWWVWALPRGGWGCRLGLWWPHRAVPHFSLALTGWDPHPPLISLQWLMHIVFNALRALCMLIQEGGATWGLVGIWRALLVPLPRQVEIGWPHILTCLIYISFLGEIFVLHPRVSTAVIWRNGHDGHTARLHVLFIVGKHPSRKNHLDGLWEAQPFCLIRLQTLDLMTSLTLKMMALI